MIVTAKEEEKTELDHNKAFLGQRGCGKNRQGGRFGGRGWGFPRGVFGWYNFQGSQAPNQNINFQNSISFKR